MSGTLSYAQSTLVSREHLMTIPPPPATSTWRPIAHGDLVSAIDRQLLVRGITIRKETFAIQRSGARLFAVLDLSIETTGEFCAAMGIRTANDRSMALEIAVGVKVFVCDNLAFSGDLIALRRKHTAKFGPRCGHRSRDGPVRGPPSRSPADDRKDQGAAPHLRISQGH